MLYYGIQGLHCTPCICTKAHADVSSGLEVLTLASLHLHPYFVYVNSALSEGSGESARLTM